jgi:hypothetical protein
LPIKVFHCSSIYSASVIILRFIMFPLLPVLVLHQRLFAKLQPPCEPWLCQFFTIAFLSTIVWGRHMFISNESIFRFQVYLYNFVDCSTQLKRFNYITTLWKGTCNWIPRLFSIGLHLHSQWFNGNYFRDSTLDIINVRYLLFVVYQFSLSKWVYRYQ